MLAYRQDRLMLTKEQMIFFPTTFRLGIHQLVERGCLQFQSIRIRDRPQIMKLKTRHTIPYYILPHEPSTYKTDRGHRLAISFFSFHFLSCCSHQDHIPS